MVLYAFKLKPIGHKKILFFNTAVGSLIEDEKTYTNGYKVTITTNQTRIRATLIKILSPQLSAIFIGCAPYSVYHILVSVTFLLIAFAANTRMRPTTELNKSTAAAKLNSPEIKPLR